MTPYHAPKRRPPSAEVDLVLHALRFSLGKLWIHRWRPCFVATVSDIHGSIELVKNCLKIFGAKLLTNGTLTILRKSSQSWILPKNKNKRTHQDFPTSITQRKFAAHSLHSILFSTIMLCIPPPQK